MGAEITVMKPGEPQSWEFAENYQHPCVWGKCPCCSTSATGLLSTGSALMGGV